MAANRYDKAVSYDYVDQYVPIPFQELVTLGKHYADERKAAEKQLSDYIKSANEFQSLIAKDVDNYYKIAMNDNIQSKINEAIADPSVMKSAAWRAGLAGSINSVDYASLSKLKQSAEQAALYDKVYKQLAAQGKMPPGWEPDYFGTYDTLSSGIFNETPMPYQTINDMIHPYVNDLKDSFLYTKGGYDWYGVDEETVRGQVNRNMSEILARPDAQRYIQMMGADNFMNAVYTAAEEKVRMKPEANPYALLSARAQYTASTRRGNGKTDENGAPLTRKQMIEHGLANRSNSWIGDRSGLNKKATDLAKLAQIASESGNAEDIEAVQKAQNMLIMEWQSAANNDRKNYMKQQFENTAKFKPSDSPQDTPNYSRDGYLRGVKSAVKSISGTIGFNNLDNNGDILLTSLGGVPQEYTTDRGNKQSVYEFTNSSGFVLPEELYVQGTQTEADKVERSFLTSNEAFPMQQMLNSGELQNIQFIPDNFENIVQMGDAKYISGKIRIPKDDIEDVFGTHLGSIVPFSGQSTRSTLKENFHAKEVTYGDDNQYYEFDIYRALPNDSNAEYWDRVNRMFENSPSHGGTGGATQAGDMALPSQESILSGI